LRIGLAVTFIRGQFARPELNDFFASFQQPQDESWGCFRLELV
jgi:hypothetical protein